jgi:hypothetical protein
VRIEAEVLPNLLYVGADRAGSTWVANLFRWHPDIFIPEVKELFFFDKYYERGLSWYSSHFEGGRNLPIVAEVCHDYLYSETALENISRLQVPIRIIICLREPLSRTISAFQYLRKFDWAPSSLQEAIDSHPELIEHSTYAPHVRRYLDRFGQAGAYVAVFDDLVEDPSHFADRMEEWLGVRRLATPPNLRVPHLPAAEARNRWLARAGKRVAIRLREAGLENVVGHLKQSRSLDRALFRRTGELDVPASLIDDLRARFTSDVHELAALTGLDLVRRWGYDEWRPS